jgi:hypothetical protein
MAWSDGVATMVILFNLIADIPRRRRPKDPVRVSHEPEDKTN